MIKGEIEKVEPLFRTQDGTPFWWEVKLKGRPETFALHSNWMAVFGGLVEGDHVQYVISKAKMDHSGSQGVDRKGWLLFEKLRKVEAAEEVEVKVEL